jgi:hypothetical protein
MSKNGLQLKDFQRATVARLVAALLDGSGDRMLVADEVGLGKTIVAKGFIEEMLARRKSLRVIYICNNQQIARQNLRKLNVSGLADAYENHDRLTLSFSQKPSRKHGLRLLGLSPQTSLIKRSLAGKAEERYFLLYLLRTIKKLRKRRGVLSRFLRDKVEKDNWKRGRDYYQFDPPKGLVTDFCRNVKTSGLLARLEAHFDARLHLKRSNNRVLIGELRQLLIEVSIDRMKADLIILDEFQRFRELLAGKDTNDEAAHLARRLFKLDNVKILLLSATPYRMYVRRGEAAPGADHYQDFRYLIHFLLAHNARKMEAYDTAWTRYQQTIDGLTAERLSAEHKLGDLGAGAQVQSMLRSIVCRTERTSLTKGKVGMVRPAEGDVLALEAADLLHYRHGELLTEAFRQAGKRAYSPLSFYKSAPYPFSFMDGYQLSKLWRKASTEQQKAVPPTSPLSPVEGPGERENLWLPINKIATYQKISYPNAAFRYLLNHTLEDGSENLLWIPPARPDYPLSGVFARKSGYSKTLLFSQWRMVPRAISTLLSYEAERRTIGKLRDEGTYPEDTNYFYEEGVTPRRSANRLKSLVEDRLTTSMTLTYPSFTLASLGPVQGNRKTRILRDLEDQLLKLFRNYRLFDDGDGTEDPNWYWQLPVLFDQAQYGGEEMAACYEAALKLADRKEVIAQFQPLIALFRTPRNQIIKDLKRPPVDLLAVVAQQALGSPAVQSLRTLTDGDPKVTPNPTTLLAALTVADGFRRFFNTPEATAVVLNSTKKSFYWREVLQYSIDGNIGAMLREYYHLVIESGAFQSVDTSGRQAAFADAVVNGANLQTASLEVYHPDQKRQLRTHFAGAYITDAVDENKQRRDVALRHSFNSPFRPFVLASTSVGQEGLDFHHYARHLVHWNLPHNPVDLEQREGRVNRYKSHAVRLGLVHRYADRIPATADFWPGLFEYAQTYKPAGTSDLVPFWHLGEGAAATPFPIVRHAPHLPFSKDARQLRDLLRTLPLYRLVLGMPDQEGLLAALGERFTEEEMLVFGEVFGMGLG